MKSSSVLHLKCQDNIETEDSVAMETTVCGRNLTCLQALIGAEQDIYQWNDPDQQNDTNRNL